MPAGARPRSRPPGYASPRTTLVVMIAGRSLVRFFILLGLIGTTAVVAVYAAIPESRVPLVEEDRLLEYASVVLYAAAAAVGLALLASPLRDRVPPAAWALPPLALVAGLDEVDWGRRVLGIEMPELHGVQVDTSQRVVKLVLVVAEDAVGWLLYLGLAVAAALLALATYRRRDRVRAAARRFWASTSGRFLILWLALACAAIPVDRAIGVSDHLLLLEETLELYAALAFLFAMLALVPWRTAPASGRLLPTRSRPD
jgi:hypothetical protein